MACTTTVKADITSTLTKSLDLSTPTDRVPIAESDAFTNGTGAGKVAKHWSDSRSFGTGGSEQIDLQDLTDAFGDDLTFDKVRVLYVKNNSTEESLYVGAPSLNFFDALFGAASDKIIIPPGGFILLSCGTSDASGWDVPTLPDVDSQIEIGEETAVGTLGVQYDIFIAGE